MLSLYLVCIIETMSYSFSMIINLTEMGTKAHLIIAVGLAAITVIGIGSHTALAIKVSKTSFQDGYNTGFAAGKKDTINGKEFDSKPPKGHSDAYDEGYRRGYDDGWFSKGKHFSANSVAAASSSAATGDGDDDDGGHKHKHKDGAAASSSSTAAAGNDDDGHGRHKDSAAASSSSSAAADGGGATAASSSAAVAGGGPAASSSSAASS
jgi:hypothetical protein